VGIAGSGVAATRGFLRGADGNFTPIEVPNGTQTYAFGINNGGQVVGRYIEPQGGTRGFLLDGGAYTTIEPMEARGDTMVFDINDGGQIVGGYFDAMGTERGFLLPKKDFTTIDVPGAADTTAQTTLSSVVAGSWPATMRPIIPRFTQEEPCYDIASTPCAQ
jgi:uncharacterized membrane protein